MFGDLEEISFNALDKKGAASVKKILLHRIIFRESQKSDEGDMLHLKYKPLNVNYKPGRMKIQQNKSAVSDLPKPEVILYPEDRIDIAWKEIRRIGPGLTNLGNTCFLNSVLQVLTYTAPLVNYVLSGHHKNTCKSVGFCMQCELSNHIVRVFRHNNPGALKPMSIIQKLNCIGKNFRFGRQEDAHEFLRFVVEAIQKSEYAGRPKLDKVSKETTVANAIFGGYYRSQVKCLQCHHESNTYDPMMDINLDIKDCSSILNAFKRSVLPDRLDGDNKYFCERCRKKTVAQKRGSIHKEPNVLTLQLKRFDFSRMFGGKVSKEVHFPEDLNIRPFMSCTKLDPMIYKLYGVLVHSGYSCNSGHYYCYVKASNGLWYEMNDSRVTQVSLKTVLSAQAYLLFYVKAKKRLNKQPTNPLSTMANDQQKHLPTKQQHTIPNGLQKPNGPQKPLTVPFNDTSGSSNESLYGVPLKRKSEPKIVFNIPAKTKLNDHSKNPFFAAKKPESDKMNSDRKNQSVSSTSNATQNKQSVEMEKSVGKKPILNSLQQLSQSYGDTDSSTPSSPSSQTALLPSPSVLSSLKTVSPSLSTALVQHSAPNIPQSSVAKASSIEETSVKINISDGTLLRDAKSNLKLPLPSSSLPTNNNKDNGITKAKKLKAHHLNRNSIWSPITKGVLHPRVIINRHSPPENGEETSKNKREENISLLTETSTTTLLTSKIESNVPSGRMFGPMMPPPPVSIPRRQRNSSITSEASSVHSQSGDWNIEEKEFSSRTLYLPNELQEKRQHVGWNVSASEIMSFHEKKSKKKKKKKKNRMSSSKPSSPFLSDGNDSLPRKHRDGECTLKRSHTGDICDNSDEMPKKKKKKKDKKRDVSDEEFPSDDINLSSSKKKKKKKKHKKHRHDDYVTSENTLDHYFDTSNNSGMHRTSDYDDRSVPRHVSSERHFSDSSFVKSSDKDISFNRSDIFSRSTRNHDISSRLDEAYTSKDGSYIDSSSKKEINKPKQKDVPVHVWDAEKKKTCTWDGAIKSKTIDQLLNSTTKVSSWSGDDNTDLYSLKNSDAKERTQDEWDEEYDAGKTKKVKKLRHDENGAGKHDGGNIFQKLQNHRNTNKDGKALIRHSSSFHHNRHHHKKHGHTHHKDHRPKYSKKIF